MDRDPVVITVLIAIGARFAGVSTACNEKWHPRRGRARAEDAKSRDEKRN